MIETIKDIPMYLKVSPEDLQIMIDQYIELPESIEKMQVTINDEQDEEQQRLHIAAKGILVGMLAVFEQIFKDY